MHRPLVLLTSAVLLTAISSLVPGVGASDVPRTRNTAPRITRTKAPPPQIPTQSYGLPLSYYWTNTEVTTTLTLNNKGNSVMMPRVTLYGRDGRRKSFSHFAIPPRSFTDVDVRNLVNQAGQGFETGSLNVFYTGRPMEMGGLLKMTNTARGLEWEEQLMYPTGERSNTLHGVGWLPQAEATGRLVVTNATGDTVTASVTIDTVSGRTERQLALGPWQLEVLDLEPSQLQPVTGQPHPGAKIVAVTISYSGRPGGVVARGLVSHSQSRYSGVIAFSDPAQAKSTKLHAGGVRISPVSDQAMQPWLVATNRGTASALLTGRVLVLDSEGGTRSVALPPTTLQPSQSLMVDARDAWGEAQRLTIQGFATLELEHNSAPGSVVVSAATISADRRHVFRVPLYDASAMPSAAGDYFWETGPTRKTLISITNTTDDTQWFRYVVRYPEGLWSPKLQRLSAHETRMIDLETLRDAQVRDEFDRVLPLSISEAQLHWSQMGGQRRSVVGRVEQADLANDVSSTYACPPASEDIYDASMMDPWWQFVVASEDASFAVLERDRDGITNDLTEWFDISEYMSWTSGNYDIVTEGSYPGQFWGVAEGETWVYAEGESVGFLYWNGEGEEPEGHEYIDEEGQIQVGCATPTNFRLTAPASINNPVQGAIRYEFNWDSTSGNKQHLQACQVGEYVDYPGGGPTFSYPLPYPEANPNDPLLQMGPGNAFGGVDIHWPGTAGNPNAFRQPASSDPVGFNATQHYGWRCPCAPGGMGNFASFPTPFHSIQISRNTAPFDLNQWKYTITKWSEYAETLFDVEPSPFQLFQRPVRPWQ